MAFDLLSAIPSVLSGIQFFGAQSKANKAEKAAQEAYLAASRTLASLTPPNLVGVLEPLQRMVYLGQITPEQAVAQLVERSAMEGIEIPAELKQTQYEVLGKLKELSETGMTVEDRARLEEIRGEIGAMERGARQAILQGAQQRGIGGSGLEMAQRMISQQGAAQRASQMGFDVAAEAQRRALQALLQSGQMAGQIRGQEFGEQSAIAQAQDAINKFNAQMKQQAEMSNVAARNRAAEQARAQEYAVQETNLAQQTREQQLRQQALQNQWQNAFGQSAAIAGRQGALGGYYGGQADTQRGIAARTGDVFVGGLEDLYKKYKTPSTPVYSPSPTPMADWAASTGIISPYKDGGVAPAGEPALIGEEGPEVVVPTQDLAVLPQDKLQFILNTLTGNKYKYGA